MAGTGLPIPQTRPVTLDPSAVATGLGKASAAAIERQWAAVGDLAHTISDIGERVIKQEDERYRSGVNQSIRENGIELFAKHPDDPEAFKAKWNGYTDGVLGSVDLRHANYAREQLAQQGDAIYGRITSAWVAKTQRLTADTINTQIDGASGDLFIHAAGGDRAGMTIAGQSVQDALQGSVRAGLMSQERADQRLGQIMAQAHGEVLVGHIGRTFKDGGRTAAEAEIDKLAADPALAGLLPAERERFQQRAVAHVNDLDRRRIRAETAQAETEAVTYAQRLAGFQKQAIDGTATEAQIIDAYHRGDLQPNDFIPLYKTIHKQGEEDATARAAILRVDGAGRPQNLSDRIISAESGGKAEAKNPNSTATGAGQFIDSTWLDMVRRNAPDTAAGKTDAQVLALRSDPALSRRMVDAYATENRAALAAQNLPTDDGAVYLAHFAGPGGAAAVLKADPATPVRDILSDGAVQANAGMKRNGRAFADWTAGDLRGWAADKVTTGPAAAYYLDPRSTEDRNAANLHWQAINKQMDAGGFSVEDRQNTLLSTIARTGIIPDDAAGDLRGKLRNGTPADRVNAARLISRIEARAPLAAKDLNSDDFAIAHLLNDQLDAGAPVDVAMQRVELSLRQDAAEVERRKQAYGGRKTEAANRLWLTKQGRHWPSANAAVPDALAQDFEDRAKDAFITTGSMDVARKVAWQDLSKVWGETSIGGKRFARYAPEAMYANGRDPTWIEGQLFHDLAQAGTVAPVETLKGRVRLEADRTAQHEQHPSYLVLEQDDLGQWLPIRGKDGAPMLGPDGMPMRWRPDWNTSPAADDERRSLHRTVDRARVSRDFRDLQSDVPPNSTAGMFNAR